MSATAVNHFTILTDDLAATLAFYERHLGLIPGRRPPFSFPGAWLYPRALSAAVASPILHVVAGKDRRQLVPGVIDHMAFSGSDLRATVEGLILAGVDYQLRRLPGDFDLWQLFFRDPNNARVEIDFDGSEPAPDGWVPGV